MSDYEVDYDERCPKCNHSPIHRRRCEVVGCDDGYIDLYHEDPVFFDRGDTEVCPGCHGTGIERWCPGCGADLSDGAKEREEAEAYARAEARGGNYSDFYNLLGDNFNVEAVCPDYLPESQCWATWRRDEQGVAIVSGYGPEDDPDAHWLCSCGRFITSGCCHCSCGGEAPWGCDCGAQDEYIDDDLDFGFFDDEARYDYSYMDDEL